MGKAKSEFQKEAEANEAAAVEDQKNNPPAPATATEAPAEDAPSEEDSSEDDSQEEVPE